MFSSQIFTDKELESTIITLKYTDSQDADKNMSISIAPELGSNLFSFRAGNYDLIYCDKELLKKRVWTGCFVLWPLPNRVRGKQYEFEGKTVSLKNIKRNKGNAVLIHGLVDDKKWLYAAPQETGNSISVKTHIPVLPEIRTYFPFKGSLTLEYILNTNGVKVVYTVENTGNTNMPFGFALHPYFSTISDIDQTTICVPANFVMRADKDLLPTGELSEVSQTEFDLRTPKTVSLLDLDHVFTGLDKEKAAVINYPQQEIRLSIQASEDFTHLVVYTMEKAEGFICLENQTGSTDMINLYAKAFKENNDTLKKAAHLLILPPHQSHTGFISYKILHHS